MKLGNKRISDGGKIVLRHEERFIEMGFLRKDRTDLCVHDDDPGKVLSAAAQPFQMAGGKLDFLTGIFAPAAFVSSPVKTQDIQSETIANRVDNMDMDDEDTEE